MLKSQGWGRCGLLKLAAAFVLCWVFSPAIRAGEPAPTVSAKIVETEEAALFQPGVDEAGLAPDHPPIELIPPMPMPEPDLLKTDVPATDRNLYLHDAQTGETVEIPADAKPGEGPSIGAGYDGADGGGGIENLVNSFANMTLISNPQDSPWRMNCKLVMRFVDQNSIARFFTGSGSMIDAETVLTAGHCVYSRDPNGIPIWDWATDIWVYPGWDGVGGQFNPPPTTVHHYGYGWGYQTAAGTAWVNDGSFDGDLGLLRLTRAVGGLTGWFSTYASDAEACATTIARQYNNASWPAESCGGGLHTGTDLYYWWGNFNSCPGQQLQIDTTGGCYNAGWGGMSGSGAYYISGSDRFLHAVCSNSNRSTVSRYCKLWQGFLDYTNNTFVPASRGTAFDLQALDVNAEPATIAAGEQTTLLNHLAYNPTNNDPASATYVFRVYLSANDNVSSTDTLLSTQNFTWDFAPMSSVRVNMVLVTIPANTPAGNYWLGLEYDSATDGDSSNNDTDGWDAVPITVTCPSQTAPTGVSATDGSYTDRVRVTWAAPAGAAEYTVYRCTDSTSGSCSALSGWQAGTTYDDYSAVVGQTYYYRVVARNACGNASSLSAYDTGWRSDICQTPPSYDYAVTPALGWTVTPARSFGRGGCNIYRVRLYAGRRYDFSLCANDGSGGQANPGDGDLALFDSAGTQLWYIDGASGCGYDASTLGTAYEGWSPATDAYHYLRVSDYYGGTMTYTLAYRQRPAELVSRNLFYNHSYFDGNKATIDPVPIAGSNNDDADAIDPNKYPLLPGDGAATFPNWIGYDKGINGLIYDVLGPSRAPVAGDFTFLDIGKDGTLAGTAKTPAAFVVQPGAGVGGSDRVIVTFANNSIRNTWLQVTIGTGFGLPAADVHYWGNAVAECGTIQTVNILVDATDEIAARNNPRTAFNRALVDWPWDYNKNSLCDATDQIIARNNKTTAFTCVKVITR